MGETLSLPLVWKLSLSLSLERYTLSLSLVWKLSLSLSLSLERERERYSLTFSLLETLSLSLFSAWRESYLVIDKTLGESLGHLLGARRQSLRKRKSKRKR
jgi:hypothetical protein